MESRIENPILNTLGVADEEARQVSLRLKEKRTQNKKTSLADLAKRLKLSESCLFLIESGDWHELPQGASGRGFIRLYAKELGVALPEFEKFFDSQKISITPQPQTNLAKIVEFARSRHTNTYQKHITNISASLQKLLTSKTVEVKQAAEQTAEPEGESHQPHHGKKWLILGTLSLLGIGAGMTAFVLNRDDLSNMEIDGQPLYSDNNVPADETSDEPAAQNGMEADSVPANAGVSASLSVSESSVPTEPAEMPASTPSTPPAPLAPSTQTAPKPVIPPLTGSRKIQKMQIDILSPVAVRIEADGKQVVDGIKQPGALSVEFQNNAVLVIEDGSKVKLSYAGWDREVLSFGARKRTIVLNAKGFVENNQ